MDVCRKLAIVVCLILFEAVTPVTAATAKRFDRAIFVIFENTSYASASRQPFFKQLGQEGANFSNFLALTHPSQGNYIALTSGDLNGVTGNGRYDLNVPNVVDLLEAKGLTWKVYAEDYPGGCFTGMSKRSYARKHNPFISFVNIQSNPSRCANIVDGSQFDVDAANGTLPNYAFYIPNMKNDGHDTGVAYADGWYSKKFSPYFSDSNFMKDTIVISTFDESSGSSGRNQIYTSIIGPAVKPGVYSDSLNLVSLLRLVEDNWSLGNLGLQDATANSIPNIWY